MIFGYEFGDASLSSKEAYEMIFLSNLSYPKVENDDKCGIEELLLSKKVSMICRVAYELEKEDNLSIALSLLKLKNKDYIETYKAFSELKNIIRTGWISRKVEENYRENDSVHSMQMFALAYAYFNLDKNISLDQKKVYEMILIHEIGEIIAGDIREGDKRHQTKRKIERQAFEKTFSHIKTGDYFISLWEEFEKKETEEAFFTYQLDKIDPILKAAFLDLELDRKDLFLDFFNL